MAYHGVMVENFHAFQMSRIRRCTTITTLLHCKRCRSEVVYAVRLPCDEAELATPDMDAIQKYSRDRWRIHVTQVATSAAEYCTARLKSLILGNFKPLPSIGVNSLQAMTPSHSQNV